MPYTPPKATLNEFNHYIQRCNEFADVPNNPALHYESHHVISKADTKVTPKGALTAKVNRLMLTVPQHIEAHVFWADCFPESYAMSWAPLGMIFTRLRTDHYAPHLKGLDTSGYLVGEDVLIRAVECYDRYLEIIHTSYKPGKNWSPENDCKWPRNRSDYGNKSTGLKRAVSQFYHEVCDHLGVPVHCSVCPSDDGIFDLSF